MSVVQIRQVDWAACGVAKGGAVSDHLWEGGAKGLKGGPNAHTPSEKSLERTSTGRGACLYGQRCQFVGALGGTGTAPAGDE